MPIQQSHEYFVVFAGEIDAQEPSSEREQGIGTRFTDIDISGIAIFTPHPSHKCVSFAEAASKHRATFQAH